jgi:plastocyanin
MKARRPFRGGSVVVILCLTAVSAQQVTLSAHIATATHNSRARAGNAVLWLTPVGGPSPPPSRPSARGLRLTQQNKRFAPHLLVVPVGSVVEFPNRDPFFHNVFSLFEGKRFDLGLYEAGTSREIRFDKPGISYIFCNIHAEMSAIVIALGTPFYGISNQRGEIVIPNVPVGRYTLRIWDEDAMSEELNAITRDITVSENTSTLGIFRLAETTLPRSHKNKYGRDYEPPTPDSPVYDHPE